MSLLSQAVTTGRKTTVENYLTIHLIIFAGPGGGGSVNNAGVIVHVVPAQSITLLDIPMVFNNSISNPPNPNANPLARQLIYHDGMVIAPNVAEAANLGKIVWFPLIVGAVPAVPTGYTRVWFTALHDDGSPFYSQAAHVIELGICQPSVKAQAAI